MTASASGSGDRDVGVPDGVATAPLVRTTPLWKPGQRPLTDHLPTGKLRLQDITGKQEGLEMPLLRRLDPTKLLLWDAQGLTAEEMRRRFADEGTTVGIDLVRLRLQAVRREARGETPAPRPQRKSSATNRRQGQLAEAITLISTLQEDLQGVLDGWGDSFAGSKRYERFQAAVESLESAAEALEPVDVSWG